jgi:hypothetical protein
MMNFIIRAPRPLLFLYACNAMGANNHELVGAPDEGTR